MFYIFLLLGLIFGSFLNVLIFRLPKNLSIIYPPSHCLFCGKSLQWYHNIPLLSYIFLKGKSHCCGKVISIQYPLVETLSMILWLWSYYYIPDISTKLLFLILSSLLLVIIFTDYRYFIIPIELNITMFFSILIYKIYNSIVIFDNLLYMIIILTSFILIVLLTTYLMKKDTMGYGDLVLIGVIGFWLTWVDILIIIFFSCILSLIQWSLIYLKTRKKNIQLPFGSALSFTTIIYYILMITYNIKL